jgi:hypothetical protein
MEKLTVKRIAVLFLILVVTACSQRTAEKPLQTIPIASDFNGVFAGSIDNHLKIQMELERDGEKLIGKYFYEQVRAATGAREYISLNGLMHPDGAFTLTESDGGKETGVFKGKFTRGGAGNEPILQLAGTWSKTGSSKELPFSAAEWRIDLGPGLQLKSAERKENDAKSKFTVDATFPQLEGDSRAATFNQEVNALVGREIGKFSVGPPDDSTEGESSFSMGYDVTLGNSNLISILLGASGYAAGAAHELGDTNVLNYDLKAGRFLELSDLFKKDSPYLQFLSDYCIRSLTRRKVNDDADWIRQGAGPDPKNYKNWNLLDGGLLITFDQYQVAAYSEGIQEVFIPFSALKEITNPSGPVASLSK